MTEVLQVRYKGNKKQLISAVTVITDGNIVFNCFFIENEEKKIPAGVYDCVKRKAGENGSRFNYEHVEVLNVKGRSGIKWHIANHYHELIGCAGPGRYAKYDIDKDGEIDVTDSKNTLIRLLKVLPQKFKVYISEKEGLYE